MHAHPVGTKEPDGIIRPGVTVKDEYGNVGVVYAPGWMYVLAFALRGIPWAIKEIEDNPGRYFLHEGSFI